MNVTRESLLFSPTRDGVPSSDDSFSAIDLVGAQDALEAEARDVLPFSFNSCTYDLGPIKQHLYACLTCLNNSAVCASCSIACHGEHQLVEIFARRNFRCDCGTERMGAGSCCSISPRADAPANAENRYDKNFENIFCICGRDYDPHTETDSMYQCVVCEDWLHHACLLGSHSDLDDAPLSPDDFDQLICGTCVSTDRQGIRRILDRYAGREGSGVMIIGGKDGRQVLGRAPIEAEETVQGAGPEQMTVLAGEDAVPTATSAAGKRKTAEAGWDGEHESLAVKRARADVEPDVDATPSEPLSTSSTSPDLASASPPAVDRNECRAPPLLDLTTPSPLAQLEQQGGRINVYLEEGWMTRWCRCKDCLPAFFDFPYLLEEEDLYEPPEDPEAHRSTMELGMDALSRMPRAQAIEGAIAFQGLSERLKAFLRPHAEAGTTITKALVDEFFAREKEGASQQGPS